MDRHSKIVVVGAGVFGLSTALELSRTGYKNVIVLDRHVPPVPAGSSVDISRVIRFDYGDLAYARLAKEAFDLWNTPQYEGIFNRSPFVLVGEDENGRAFIDRCTTGLGRASLSWRRLETGDETKNLFPVLSGQLTQKDFHAYCNFTCGWADSQLAIATFRDRCLENGVSFISGSRGTVPGFQTDPQTGTITGAKTKSGDLVQGDVFVLATGAWTSGLVSMHDSILATGQVVAFIKLTETEVDRYGKLPIYMNFSTGWLSFPPHQNSGYMKIALHGWGYTHTADADHTRRANFAPADGLERVRQGLRSVLPELASREFDRAAVCWYTDTPSGDFIVDSHPDYPNLLVTTAETDSNGFKFLPVIGKYTTGALHGTLPEELRQKWRFRREYENAKGDPIKGDGIRRGPARREFLATERAKL
ncbi:hypothetical protein A1O1_01799 [Capronia coronata CBS 617.96]|uniref:FAD dependent oxidoreductase domain-containing protein n=1 Tax=Capronia coronata CBS 617.96 TaxID=1182541 RepID=W9YKK1_9EURO|nr:uncharacterized protein A1O1_01799 [Capronia coronata CBS 617.96]EXJ93407.1 hypothetical protein A1O1_01799 [Capronia coronata CBS 617.96]